MTNTVRKSYTIEVRTDSGWKLAGMSKRAFTRREATALERMAGFAESNPRETFRVIDSTGAILAVRAPSS